MVKKKIVFVPSLFFLSLLIYFLSFLTPHLALGERPFFATERAIPVEKGMYKLETGLALDHFSAQTRETTLSLDLRYGLIHNLELDAELPYLFIESGHEHENQVGDILLRSKVRFLKGREANPLSVAGELMIKLPTAGRHELFQTTGKADIGFLAIASKEFAPVTAHINFGYVFIGNPPLQDKPDQLRYSLGLEFKTKEEPLMIIGELSGTSEVGNSASNGLLSLLGGISFEADPNILIDTSVGLGMTHDTPDYTFNVGVTYAFH